MGEKPNEDVTVSETNSLWKFLPSCCAKSLESFSSQNLVLVCKHSCWVHSVCQRHAVVADLPNGKLHAS